MNADPKKWVFHISIYSGRLFPLFGTGYCRYRVLANLLFARSYQIGDPFEPDDSILFFHAFGV
jgi:hypothetical protein